MSTGSISLDILLNQILTDALRGSNASIKSIQKKFPTISEKEALEIFAMISAAAESDHDGADLVITAPPSFALKTKPTKITVNTMLTSATSSILITGYSLSDYFNDLIDCVIRKSQEGVLVKFFVNDIENQKIFERLYSYRGKFLRIFNYPKQEDKMSALHAKVISVDQKETLITSANLSYHGQEGNIELGAQIHSKALAKQVDALFTKLLFAKVFKEVI
ncbi:phospholipase D-like domain-containing protein [Allofournierella sp. CML151]|uniref:phospholipase D-like domain-containing protein n=1 Tax=Allofournierella sp. CML151 TaxID=2998082 RepID=UPI0022EB11CF|nr:phospholipase D-like domain-containing protein [Fournierella sp. CML151]